MWSRTFGVIISLWQGSPHSDVFGGPFSLAILWNLPMIPISNMHGRYWTEFCLDSAILLISAFVLAELLFHTLHAGLHLLSHDMLQRSSRLAAGLVEYYKNSAPSPDVHSALQLWTPVTCIAILIEKYYLDPLGSWRLKEKTLYTNNRAVDYLVIVLAGALHVCKTEVQHQLHISM